MELHAFFIAFPVSAHGDFFAANAIATQKSQCKYLYCSFVFFDQSKCPAAGLRALGHEIPVDARLLDQLVMGALLDDAPLVQYQDLIRTVLSRWAIISTVFSRVRASMAF